MGTSVSLAAIAENGLNDRVVRNCRGIGIIGFTAAQYGFSADLSTGDSNALCPTIGTDVYRLTYVQTQLDIPYST